jgi:DNA-binding PadR family transcriptional regulator
VARCADEFRGGRANPPGAGVVYTTTRYSLPRQIMTEPRALSPQVFQILLSLAEEDLHGYAIIGDVRERTAGEMRLTASTLYAALKRLLDERLIEELAERPRDGQDDARRRYYRITRAGREAGRREAARLETLAAMARGTRWLPGRRHTR